MEKHSVSYNGRIIEFELLRKNIKNINLNVKPDMTVMVSASEKVPLDYIKKYVRSKAFWILKNISYFGEVQSEYHAKREFVSGESYKYLGKQYRLKIMESEEEGVKYYRGYIHLFVKDKTNYARKANLLNRWFRERADTVFEESLAQVFRLVEKHGVIKPEIGIRTMKARWGSCVRDKGIILLNYELIKAPKYCIDYVVLHELIHFKERNHNEAFYNLIYALMPDWKKRKAILDEEVIRDL